MTYAIGAAARLAFKKESAYGTNPGGTDWLQLPFIPPLRFGADQALIDSNVIGIGPTRDPSDPFYDGINVPINFAVPLDKTELGRWLQLMCGAPATSGSSNYTHVFKSGGLTLPSASLELGHPGLSTPQYFLATGVRADTLEINVQPTGQAQAAVTFIAQGCARSGTTVDASLTAPASYEQFNNFQAALTRNGSALASVTQMTLRVGNGLEALRTIRGDQKIDEAIPGGVTVGGTLTARFGDPALTLESDAEGTTPLDLTVTWTISGTKSLELKIPRAFLPQKLKEVSGRAGVDVNYEFRGAYDASAGAAFVATLKNQTASY